MLSLCVQQVEDELSSPVVLFKFSQAMSAGKVSLSESDKLIEMDIAVNYKVVRMCCKMKGICEVRPSKMFSARASSQYFFILIESI